MRNKYQRLSKEEKKECRNMYYNTIKGKEMHLRFVRLTITGIIGILFSVYLIANGIINNQFRWYDYLVIIPLMISSFIFILGTVYLRRKVLNQFALTIPRFKNK